MNTSVDTNTTISAVNLSNSIKSLDSQYSDLKNELIKFNVHNSLINSVNEMDNNYDSNNQRSINALDADLMTTRRQVEIVNNSSLIKEDVISVLKASFTLLSLAFINLSLNKNEVYRKYVFYALIIIALIFFSSKLLEWSIRHVNRWTIHNYPKQITTSTGKNNNIEEEIDECALEEKELQDNIDKTKARILSKLAALNDKRAKIEKSKLDLEKTKKAMETKYDENVNILDKIYNLDADSKKITLSEKEAILEKLKEEYRLRHGTLPTELQLMNLIKNLPSEQAK
jgi:hypothetical protein